MNNKIKISLYWKCQLIGWSVAALYWQYLGVTGGRFDIPFGILQFVTDVFFYVLLTHLYRIFALKHHFQDLDVKRLLIRIIPSVIILAIGYTLVTAVKIYLLRTWFVTGFSAAFFEYSRQFLAGMFMAGLRLMSIWLLAYHMYHYAQREIRTSKENARLAVISREAQLNNLSAQLNPHFLFNSLNNIKALVNDNPKSARRAIDLLSDLLRTSLYTGDVTKVSLHDELNLVRDYLELEKLRFEERLQFEIKVGDKLDAIQVPRLCIQTLVENAIKHGIAKRKNGGLIAITIVKAAGFVIITVQNPGVLEQPAGGDAVGLKNLRERLALEYKGMATFAISGELQDIVLATIKIPSV